MSDSLQAAIERVIAGGRDEADIHAIVAALQTQKITLETGKRAVAIAGSADDAVIVTGDRNIIVSKELAQLLQEKARGITNLEQQFGDRQNTFINFFMLGSEQVGAKTQQGQGFEQVSLLLEQLNQPGIVQQVYRETLPVDANLSRSQTMNYDQIVTNLQDFRRLPDFVQQLANHADIPQSVREKLAQTIQQPYPAISQDANIPTLLQSHLLITLRPATQSDEFLVNGWLIPDDTVQDQASRFHPLDIDLSQKGAACKISQLPELLDKFVQLTLEHLMGRRYELTIEIFLPLDYLCTGVDGWTLTDTFFEDESYVIGTKYRVIVRSRERLEPKYLASRLNQWYVNWDRIKSCWHKPPNDGDFEHLSDLENCNWKWVINNLMQKLGLKLTCGLIETHKKELFTCILKAAAPIALWTRCSCTHWDQVTEMNELLLAGPLLTLSEMIRKKRQNADLADKPEDHLGAHLALLWEDPYRPCW
jgi:hypothetical protein